MTGPETSVRAPQISRPAHDASRQNLATDAPASREAIDAFHDSEGLGSEDLTNRLESFETIDAIFDALAEGDEEKLDEALLSDLTDESEIFAHEIQHRFHP